MFYSYSKNNNKPHKNINNNFNINIISISKLKNTDFNLKDKLNLSSFSEKKVFITNFPNIGEIYTPTANIDHFKITPTGLIPYKPKPPITKLANSIIIKNSSDNEVAKVEFHAINKKFIITSTDETSDNIPTNAEFFILRLKHIATQRLIKTAEILSNETGSNFLQTLNNFSFTFDENFLELNYFLPSKINITNYPNKDSIHIPTVKKEFFKLTAQGLMPYTPPSKPEPPMPSSITIPEEIFIGTLGDIKFNTEDLTLLVFSFQVFPNPFLPNTAYLLFKLRDSNEQIKYNALFRADEVMDKFASRLHNRNFKIGDIIELDCISDQSLKIKNFPNLGELTLINTKFFNLEGVKKYLKITENGLEDYIPTSILHVDTLQNTIRIKNILNIPVIVIEFNTLDKVIRTFKFSDEIDSSSTYDYFTFKLLDSNNSLIFNSTLKSKDMLQDFLDEVNFKIFDYNYVIELSYNDKSRNLINITNFPTKKNTHIPTTNLERYLITNTGLQSL
ncbi:hypothetical protein [Clostridium tarantellae]|uniref:DUF3794 domain-containing protein n=1 Tax=Clostridium tarantellae TaxID=39493 RepID=A0A6I1MLD5_9CLOT|nr:hypothetical protein [Clostridium tarantellae]MPQ43804.1 hypothetical protein [Clostridium tarantellae]